MVLSPADFYAYSEATGVPVPDTFEERAALTRDVLNFRRNQLKAAPEAQEGPNPLALGLGIGLGLAGLAGAGVAARRLLGGRQRIPKAPPTVANTGTVVQDLEKVVNYNRAPVPSQPSPTVNTLVDKQRTQSPSVVDQQTTAVRPSQEQKVDPIENAAQRDIDSAKFGIQQVETEQVNRKLSNFELFSQRANEIQSGSKKNAFAAQSFLENDYSEGLLAELMEQAGLSQPQTPSGPKFSAFDISGKLESVPGAQTKKSPLFRAELTELAPLAGPSTGAGEDLGIGIGTKTVREKLRGQTIVAEGGRRIGMTETEIADRISAAANYEPGSEINQLLLNPDVPTEKVLNFMPSTLKVRGGRVGTNLTSEVAPGARASMTDVPSGEEFKSRFIAATHYPEGSVERANLQNMQIPLEDVTPLMVGKKYPKSTTMGVEVDYDPSYEGSDINAYNTRTGNTEFEQLTEELDEGSVRRFSDYDTNASDYGDVEGPGGLVESETYTERTKSGSTQVPGQVQLTSGIRPGTERQERVADVQIPTRSTLEGDVARGYFIDEETGQLRFQGEATRSAFGRLQSSDVNVEGSRNIGGYELPTAIVEAVPVGGDVWVESVRSDYGNTLKLMQQPGSKPPRNLSQSLESDAITVQPYMVNRVEQTFNPVTKQKEDVLVKRPIYGSLVDDNLKPVSVSRSYLTNLAQQGQEIYYNNPQAVRSYLERVDPDVARAVYQEGTLTLEQAAKPYHKTGFIADYVDSSLRSETSPVKVGLPVLRDPSAKHRFVTDVLSTSKEVLSYGKPIGGEYKGKPYPVKGSEGEPMLTAARINRVNPRTGQVERVTVAGPVKTDVAGFGGIDPMTIETEGSALAANVGYKTPRISTTPRRVTQASEAPVPLNPLQLQMQSLRTAMETAPVGYKTPSPGSFARTQNPYSAAAAAAMGPASRASEANYQYPEQQLAFRTQPVSQRQLLERNALAYAANLTPGGRVVPGAQSLGQGLPTIQAGIGPLTESETVSRYGVTGRQLQEFGNALMGRAAYKRGLQPGPTSVRQRISDNPLADYQNFAFADEYQRTLPLAGTLKTASPADIEAAITEIYMGKLQRGRSTPLTSQAVIQPKLF